jgi:hypothetical protein
MAELLHSSQLLLKQIWDSKSLLWLLLSGLFVALVLLMFPKFLSEIMSSLACTKPFKMMNGLVHVSDDIWYSRKELWEHGKDKSHKQSRKHPAL